MNKQHRVIRYETDDYSLFSFIKKNRDVENMAKHQTELKASMERNGFFACRPLIVREMPSGKLQIIDGQNRFFTAKALGISVIYEIDQTVSNEALADLQISRTWLPKDYVHMHVVEGNPHMVYLDNLQKAHPRISYGVIVGLLMGNLKDNGAGYQEIRKGNLDMSYKKQTEVVLNTVEQLYNEIPPLKSYVTKRAFVKALMSVQLSDAYDHDRFIDKMSKYNDLIHCGLRTVSAWIITLERIYNYNTRKGDKVSFQ